MTSHIHKWLSDRHARRLKFRGMVADCLILLLSLLTGSLCAVTPEECSNLERTFPIPNAFSIQDGELITTETSYVVHPLIYCISALQPALKAYSDRGGSRILPRDGGDTHR